MTKAPQKYFACAAFAFMLGMGTSAFGETTGQFVDDATITAKVKEAILADSELSVFQVGVDTSHGTVTLTGSVDTKAQDTAAVKDAKLINGVAYVNDKLTIKGQ